MIDEKTKTNITENIINEAYNVYEIGYNDGKKKGYEEGHHDGNSKGYMEGLKKGSKDAWNAARRLLSSTSTFLRRLGFDDSLTAPQVICDYSAMDIISRIEKEVRSNRIFRIGDEVVCKIDNKTIKMYLTNIEVSPTDCYLYSGICEDGNVIDRIFPDDIYKTGMYSYKLKELLEDINCEP